MTQPFVRTTTALTMFNAGVKENVVPQRAEAKVNFRLLPGDTPEMVVETMTAIVDDPGSKSAMTTGIIRPCQTTKAGASKSSAKRSQPCTRGWWSPSLLAATTDTRHYIELAITSTVFTV